MVNKEVTRYKQFPDKSSYHSSGSFLRIVYTKLRAKIQGFEIGLNSKIMNYVDIKITKGGKLKIGSNVTIADYAFIQLTKPFPNVEIGDYTVVGRNVIIASKTDLTIGKYVLIGPSVQINDQFHGMDRNDLIINQKAILKPVMIEDDVWLGAGVKIMPGVKIGEGSIIGANSVVTHDVPSYQIWAGNPAKFIRERI